jgi:hypothetical protein
VSCRKQAKEIRTLKAVVEAAERIRRLPDVFVDCGVGQGRDAFQKQLEERSGKDESASVDGHIDDLRSTIEELAMRATPYGLPDDYVYFLEFYGGLAIDTDDYYFAIMGVGAMVEERYSSVVSDEALQNPGAYGFLSLGVLSFRAGEHRFQRVSFFLDLTGTIQRYCVIGVGPWGKGTLTPDAILKALPAHHAMWQMTASSFTGWLERAADTRGAFGYA